MLIQVNVLANDINHVRTLYPKASEDFKLTKELLAYIQTHKLNTATAWGYRGALEALMAKHESNPFTKLSYLKKCSNTFAKAIEASPADIELRILRYITEVNTPSTLGYSENVAIDKKTILDYLSKNTNYKPDYQMVILLKILKLKGKLTATESAIVQKFIA